MPGKTGDISTKVDNTRVAGVVKPKVSFFDTPDRSRTIKKSEAAAKAAAADKESLTRSTFRPMKPTKPKAPQFHTPVPPHVKKHQKDLSFYERLHENKSERQEEGMPTRPQTRATGGGGSPEDPPKTPPKATPTKGKKETAPGQDKKNGKEKEDKKSKYAGGGKYSQILQAGEVGTDSTGPKSEVPTITPGAGGGVPGGGDSAEERRSSRLKKNVEKSKKTPKGKVNN